MKRFLNFLLFILLLVTAVAALQVWRARGIRGVSLRHSLLGLFHGGDRGHRRPEKYTLAAGPRVNVNDVDLLSAISRQRVLLAKTVIPSVVSITTSKTLPNNGDPFFQFFHQGMRRDGAVAQKALGSGAIISREGHIVTNDHVIDQMDQIEVKLSDGRVMQAKLIGTDSDTDLAILKIDADNLQPLPLGDSEAVEVGETVLAVGNPYGLDESVTQGIISAKGRRSSENLSDLFQTDAAINPGNSGGPLVNVRGELVGINEAIYSETGGGMGVGFAIPAATVRNTMDSILKTGRVIHGYLGIYQQPANEEGLRQRGLSQQKGVLVNSVAGGSPAEKADIQPGDFIQKFNDKPINNFQDLRHGVAEVEVDKSVSIELLRDGRKVSVQALIAEKPPSAERFPQAPQFRFPIPPPALSLPDSPGSTRPRTAPADGNSLAGVQVVELLPSILQKLNLPADLQGVIVGRIEPGAPASSKLQLGDVIEQINQQPVTSLVEFGKLVRALPKNQPVVLSIMRERARSMVVIGSE